MHEAPERTQNSDTHSLSYWLALGSSGLSAWVFMYCPSEVSNSLHRVNRKPNSLYKKVFYVVEGCKEYVLALRFL